MIGTGNFFVCLFRRKPEGTKRPIEYWSRTITEDESYHETNDREILAVFQAFLIFRPYLESSRFTIRTDHSEIKWNIKIAGCNGRISEWSVLLI